MHVESEVVLKREGNNNEGACDTVLDPGNLRDANMDQTVSSALLVRPVDPILRRFDLFISSTSISKFARWERTTSCVRVCSSRACRN